MPTVRKSYAAKCDFEDNNYCLYENVGEDSDFYWEISNYFPFNKFLGGADNTSLSSSSYT